jgi:hypothetical protein
MQLEDSGDWPKHDHDRVVSPLSSNGDTHVPGTADPRPRSNPVLKSSLGQKQGSYL